jgi:hypothetical protein
MAQLSVSSVYTTLDPIINHTHMLPWTQAWRGRLPKRLSQRLAAMHDALLRRPSSHTELWKNAGRHADIARKKHL